MYLYMYLSNSSGRCAICGRVFQGIARGGVCCGVVAALLVGHPTRLQSPVPGPIKEDVLRIAFNTTSTASVGGSGGFVYGPSFSTDGST